MGELFPISVDSVVLTSSRFRLIKVQGDHMAPQLRHDRDFVLAIPVDRYEGPGRYVLQLDGEMLIYDCEKRVAGREVWLACANENYRGRLLNLDTFNDVVVAKVGADVKVRDEAVLRRAV